LCRDADLSGVPALRHFVERVRSYALPAGRRGETSCRSGSPNSD
jgi:hypothetical protein